MLHWRVIWSEGSHWWSLWPLECWYYRWSSSPSLRVGPYVMSGIARPLVRWFISNHCYCCFCQSFLLLGCKRDVQSSWPSSQTLGWSRMNLETRARPAGVPGWGWSSSFLLLQPLVVSHHYRSCDEKASSTLALFARSALSCFERWGCHWRSRSQILSKLECFACFGMVHDDFLLITCLNRDGPDPIVFQVYDTNRRHTWYWTSLNFDILATTLPYGNSDEDSGFFYPRWWTIRLDLHGYWNDRCPWAFDRVSFANPSATTPW